MRELRDGGFLRIILKPSCRCVLVKSQYDWFDTSIRASIWCHTPFNPIMSEVRKWNLAINQTEKKRGAQSLFELNSMFPQRIPNLDSQHINVSFHILDSQSHRQHGHYANNIIKIQWFSGNLYITSRGHSTPAKIMQHFQKTDSAFNEKICMIKQFSRLF